jgi:general L-amino acid transport system substrate-binding protein
MKKIMSLGALAVLGLAGAAQAATLDDVRARGTLNCGVNPGLTGFAAPDASGRWEGFDVDLCRAVAATVFGDPEKVTFTPLSGETRFTALAAGEVDLLARNSTWTFSRDTDLKLDFVAWPRPRSSTGPLSASRPAPRPS